MEPIPSRISARSKREVMDWALVLASQEIEATLHQDEQGWALLVDERDFERAVSAIKQYRHENRGWKWRQHVPGSDLIFHSGSLIWVAAVALLFFWSESVPGSVKQLGIMDSQAVAKGQWWRLFTAVTLHADWSHLSANLTTGFLLLGLAMARFGPAVALLAAYFAGVLGNAGALLFFTEEARRSLGASGMVTGALGLVAMHSFGFWRQGSIALGILWRAVAAAVLILVLIGFSPESDVLAHVGGFVAGIVLGWLLSYIQTKTLNHVIVNLTCGVVLAGLVVLTWTLALVKH